MERRQAFKLSIQKLIDLTQKGSIWDGSQWEITKALFGRKDTNAMHQLGVFVAKQILEFEKDQSKAAAILLLICLDLAYNAVVSVSLSRYLEVLERILMLLVYGYDGRVHEGPLQSR